MTQTIQLRSCAYLSEELSAEKLEMEENLRLLLSLFDNLNILCEKLSTLDYLLQRKNLELNVLDKGMEELK